MLGINELGYTTHSVTNTPRSSKDPGPRPDAIIFVCANFHVSEGRSEGQHFQQPEYRQLNGYISRLADGETIFTDITC